jgi:predicted  nucleic acid-binding Zn-ribbon protein
MLGVSKKELEELRQELETLRQTSTWLSGKAESLNQESDGLRQALMKAENSLRSLEQSFAIYRMSAEERIRYLERQRSFLKYGVIIGAVLALSGWTAFAAGR